MRRPRPIRNAWLHAVATLVTVALIDSASAESPAPDSASVVAPPRPVSFDDFTPAPPNPPVEGERLALDYQDAMYDLLEATLREQYLAHGHRDPAWDERALALIAASAADRVSGRFFDWVNHPGVRDWKERLETARAVMADGCDDPLIKTLYLNSFGADLDERMRVTAEAVSGMAERRYHGLPVLYAMRQRIDAVQDDRGDWRPIAERLAAACAGALDRPDLDAMQQAALYRLVATFITGELEHLEADRLAALIPMFENADCPHPWVRAMILGRLEKSTAWEYRGGGWASTVTAAQWQKFDHHLARAIDHFERAHRLDPSHPHAATELIGIHGAGHGTPSRDWLHEATAAVTDWPSAYNAAANFRLPRWGGTPDEMWRLAEEALQGDRFDTLRPEIYWSVAHQLRRVHDQGAHEPAPQPDRYLPNRTPSYWVRPHVWPAFQRYFAGRAEHPIRLDEYERRMRSLPAVAWACGQYGEAVKAIEALGDDFDPTVFRSHYVVGPLAVSECYARIDPAVRAALINTPPGRPPQPDRLLADRLRPVLAAMPETHRGRSFVEAAIRHGEWERRYGVGKWFNMLGDAGAGLSGWVPRTGEWSATPQGAAVGVSQAHESYSGLALLAPYDLGQNVELKGRVAVLQGNDRTNITLMFEFREGDTRHHYRSVAFYPDRNQVYVAIDGWRNRQKYDVPLGDEIEFRVVRLEDRVWVWVGDTLVVDDEPLPGRRARPPGRLAVGGAYWQPGVELRFDSLIARRLDPAPAGVPGAPRAPGS